MLEVSKLQEILNKRAEEKVKSRMSNFIEAIQRDRKIYELLSEINIQKLNDEGKLVVEPMSSAFYNCNRSIPEQLIEKMLPEAIEEESEEFVKQIDSMKDQLENLTGNL